jgi:CRP/FNR family transcriptional regulator
MMNRQITFASPLLEGLEPEHEQIIGGISHEKKYPRGRVIFVEGEKADGFYIVESGQVKIYKTSFEGKEQILHLFGKGETFGEVAVFAGHEYPASAKAMTNARCRFIPRNDFIAMIQRNPTLAMNMMAIMALRLRRFAAMIENLSLKEAPGRLCSYLLYLSERSGDTLLLEPEASKSQLAALLGAVPETLSRILTRMERMDLIKRERTCIRILNKPALLKIAGGEMKIV